MYESGLTINESVKPDFLLALIKYDIKQIYNY